MTSPDGLAKNFKAARVHYSEVMHEKKWPPSIGWGPPFNKITSLFLFQSSSLQTQAEICGYYTHRYSQISHIHGQSKKKT